MHENTTFGDFIRTARKKKRNLPLAWLSRQVGISPAQLLRIEENRVSIYPAENFLNKLSMALGVEYETLVDLLYHHKAGNTEAADSLQEIPLIPWEFLSNIQNISPEAIAKGYISVQTDNSEHSVAVRCQTAKWQPFINENDIIVFLINMDPEEDNFIMSTAGEGECDILRVSKQDKKLFHFPAFTAFQQSQPLSDNDNRSIIGVVDQVIRLYRDESCFISCG
ncbi:MAG: helix-turn-helix transcriptional regulator [bacterium]|nr:helix-turn-helix transcriptional regulator [bacterium]